MRLCLAAGLILMAAPGLSLAKQWVADAPGTAAGPATCAAGQSACDVMRSAMELANAGDFRSAARLASGVWERTSDDAAGFTLVLLLEQVASGGGGATVDECCRIEARIEAGRVARDLLRRDRLPALFRAGLPEVVFREAVAWAESGCPDHALSSLRTAFELGYSGFDAALEAPAFRDSSYAGRLESLVGEAREQAARRIEQEVRNELAAFRPFRFVLDSVDIDGEPVRLDALGDRVVVIDFWGSWCPACQLSVPMMVGLRERFPDDCEVILLASEGGDPESAEASARRSLGARAERLRVVVGDPSLQSQVPDFPGFPTVLVLDRQGMVRWLGAGPADLEKVSAAVRMVSRMGPAPEPSGGQPASAVK